MTSSLRILLILAGIVGLVFSGVGIVRTFEVIRTNGLTDGEPVGLRDYYLQIGSFYSQGFTTGFFLCFSLMLLAIAIGTWYEEKRLARTRSAAGAASVPAGAARTSGA